MYLDFFGLQRSPFDPAPEQGEIFETPTHAEAMASIVYGVLERKGLVVVSGEVGVGKTTVLRHAVKYFASTGSDYTLIQISNPAIDAAALVDQVAAALGLPADAVSASELSVLHARLRAIAESGGRVVLIIDEAQHVPEPTLEFLRILSNLEGDGKALLQIVLVGQPELPALLALPAQRALRQRIAVRATIRMLSAAETKDYILFRLTRAGGRPREIMDPSALRKIVSASGGLPRRINIIADNALISGFGAGKRPIDAGLVARAVRTLDERPPSSRGGFAADLLAGRGIAAAAGVVAVAAIVAVAAFSIARFAPRPAPAVVSGRPIASAALEPPAHNAVQPPPATAVEPPLPVPAQTRNATPAPAPLSPAMPPAPPEPVPRAPAPLAPVPLSAQQPPASASATPQAPPPVASASRTSAIRESLSGAPSAPPPAPPSAAPPPAPPSAPPSAAPLAQPAAAPLAPAVTPPLAAPHFAPPPPAVQAGAAQTAPATVFGDAKTSGTGSQPAVSLSGETHATGVGASPSEATPPSADPSLAGAVPAEVSGTTNLAMPYTVHSGEWLYQILREHELPPTPQVLAELKRLNPGLANIDDIYAGQNLRLPTFRAKQSEPQTERAK